MSGTSLPQSWWWTAPHASFAPLEHDVETDVLVIGGGVTGLTLAWTLLEQGATVAVLEAGRLAGEASGRNAGFLLAAPGEPYVDRIAFWGREGARALLTSGRRTHQRIHDLVTMLGIDCEYEQRGSLRLSTSAEETEDMRASLAALREDGSPLHEVALADVLSEHARPHFHAAFESRDDGQIHPVKFLHALATHAVQRGVHVHEHTRVTAARWREGHWEVHAGGRTARARTLVLATNAFAAALVPELASLIQPRRGQMLATAPLGTWISPRPTYAHLGYRYWRQTPDTRLVIGGWRDTDFDGEAVASNETSPRVQDGILEGLRVLVPHDVAIEHRWAGIMGFARDGRPLVGWLDASHHLAICAGFTGHGMGMAAACTQDLADLLAWRRAAGLATYDPHRFRELQSVRESLTTLGDAIA